MSAPRASALTLFRVKTFRFQWPADLTTSWAFEMETLILGWYVLVETGSVLMLTVFASLQYVGTLISPMMGVVADRLGVGNVLTGMRAGYTLLSAFLMAAALLGSLSPHYVLGITALMGLIKPSDMGMRAALVGETVPGDHLVGAMGIQRTTFDSARIAGALSGAGIVAALGMGVAYIVITVLYAASFMLTLKVARLSPKTPRPSGDRAHPSPWQDLLGAARYVRHAPALLGTLWVALLINLTAFPIVTGVLPYVAKEIYRTDQTGLGYLVAAFAAGGLAGSLIMSRRTSALPPGRLMIGYCAVWLVLTLVFAQTGSALAGLLVLIVIGFAQSLCVVPMAALLLRSSEPRYRGRVMGLRMLAIYGLPVGLLVAGPLIAGIGYRAAATLYALAGGVALYAIWWRYRPALWSRDAPVNRL